MQMERLVNFHKVLADPTRIRILTLLSMGPLHGQALAGKLGVKPPTITHHMMKLREAGLVKEKRDKNTIYFTLDEKTLKRDAVAIVDVVFKETSKEEGIENMSNQKVADMERERVQIIKNFFAADGTLKQIPTQRKKKLYVFEKLLQGLEMGKKYPEKEINEYIKKFHDDYATIRREFIMNHYMYREDGIYEMNPPEMWAKIE